MIVMKFGGSSVADAACMREVGELVTQALPRSPLVVLSAAGKTTDALFAMARQAEAGQLEEALEAKRHLIVHHRGIAFELMADQTTSVLEDAITEISGELELLLRGVALLRELSLRSLDAIASAGERLSTRILATYLGAQWFDARAAMRTDDCFGAARPLGTEMATLVIERLAPYLAPGRAVVTQGYIGATAEGLTTTLGRGGSDYSASLFGSVLGAEDIQIWTDVEGVLTCDPRIVPEARPIGELSFAEAAELAAFGAKVLHPATIQPAVEAGIPVTVRHTRRPQGRFTTITGEVRTGRPVTAIASRGPVTVLTVSSARMLNQSGFLARLFDVFARYGVSVDLIATAEVSVSLTVEADVPLNALLGELGNFATVCVATNRAIVAVVGERLKVTPGITGRCFTALSNLNIEMISFGANEINLSLVVRQEDAPHAIRQLHATLIEGDLP
ncbi:MAG: lysine-sensitive aspartokinase 3 [Holophaga sp.]|nr:lysine-sensitive aspartokinase 3 [Holophaga sp.]